MASTSVAPPSPQILPVDGLETYRFEREIVEQAGVDGKFRLGEVGGAVEAQVGLSPKVGMPHTGQKWWRLTLGA